MKFSAFGPSCVFRFLFLEHVTTFYVSAEIASLIFGAKILLWRCVGSKLLFFFGFFQLFLRKKVENAEKKAIIR